MGDRYLVPLCSPGTAAVYAYIIYSSIYVHGSNLNLSCDNGVAITFQIATKTWQELPDVFFRFPPPQYFTRMHATQVEKYGWLARLLQTKMSGIWLVIPCMCE